MLVLGPTLDVERRFAGTVAYGSEIRFSGRFIACKPCQAEV